MPLRAFGVVCVFGVLLAAAGTQAQDAPVHEGETQDHQLEESEAQGDHVDGGAAPVQTCVACHTTLRDPQLRQVVENLSASVHGRPDIGCSDCHGGRPDVPSVRAHDRTEGFRSRIETGAMPETCGNCHSDPARFAGADHELPTDQLAGYRLSVHGRAHEGGNDRAPTCWDCHGSHDVLPPTDPDSKVHPRHVADTCGRCHKSRERMAASELPTDQFRQWEQSVHGRAHAKWEERLASGAPEVPGEIRPPACNDCHGEHDVEEGELAVQACEGCHEKAWEAFRASPHFEAFESKGFVACVECHGSHEVEPVDATLVGIDQNASCHRCHRVGQEMIRTIRRLARKQRGVEDRALLILEQIDLAPQGPELDGHRDAIREKLSSLRLAIHTLDEETIEAAIGEVDSVAQHVAGRIPDGKEELARKRRLALVIVVGCIGLAAGFVILMLVWKKQ